MYWEVLGGLSIGAAQLSAGQLSPTHYHVVHTTATDASKQSIVASHYVCRHENLSGVSAALVSHHNLWAFLVQSVYT